ncbi:MAG: hypothetical protein NXH88_11055 [Hyphomonas sp.]|nr:hypothetical protein [Hyphomonas sp.]
MPNTHIKTFLRGSLTDSLGLVNRYAGYGTGGGYNYWQSSEKALHDMTIGGQAYDQAVGHCTKIHKSDERLANQNVVKKFHDWSTGRKLAFIQPPQGIVEGPKKVLTIMVKPDLAFAEKGTKYVVLTWPYHNVPLSNKMAGLGVHIMRSVLATGEFKDAMFCVHDTTKSKVTRHLHGRIPKNAEELFAYLLNLHETAYIQSHPEAA